MFEIYMHKFKTSGKVYIGQTCKGVLFRLRVHINDAMRCPKTKFHKAILKYGVEDIETSILDKTETKDESDRLEKLYIQKFDSFKTGYNMTLGGDGGDIFSLKSEEEKVKISKRKSISSTGPNNGRYCGLTDDDLVNIGLKFFIENNYKITINAWKKYSKENGLPQNYSKFRFNGEKYKGFIDKLKSKLIERNIQFTEDNFLKNKYDRYKSLKYDYLINKQFGDYTIKSESFRLNHGKYVLYRCVCGNLKSVRCSDLDRKNKCKCKCIESNNAKNN